MSQQSAGWEDKLASLKHVFPQFPADRWLIWQRPNAEFKTNDNGNVKSNPNGKVKNNFNGNFKSNPNVKTNSGATPTVPAPRRFP
jgi:hypothetical protein